MTQSSILPGRLLTAMATPLDATNGELVQPFCAIARSVDLPMIVYNIPSRSPRNMETGTTLRLAREVSNIIGVKEASANFKQIGEIIRGAPDGFRVWSGNDADTLSIL